MADLLDQAFTRAAGASRVEGNRLRLLQDGPENYPAWLDAIASAEKSVHFENYIVRDDATGRRFAEAFCEKARQGVAVRVLYDWMGGVGKSSRGFWRALRDAGVEVRTFNPLRLESPFGWLHRDHRKCLVVDGRVGFVSGLCVGDEWAGANGKRPWRDTGVEVRGPAVADVAAAFARTWAAAGPPLSETAAPCPEEGDVPVRVVATEPATAGLMRVDELVASAARERLWLTDAYFAGVPTYVQALRAAARDGVDVRLLVPCGTDLPVLRPLSRAGYRTLIEAGVRVFEWNGPMLHAKTAVADGRWARVGSSNLNVASWLGNYELDLVVEHAGFAAEMARQFEADLAEATEVVLKGRKRNYARPGGRGGSAGRTMAGALRLGRTVTAVVADHRVLDPPESRVVACFGLLLLVLAAGAFLWPRVFAWPFGALLAWFAAALLGRAWRLRRSRRGEPPPPSVGPLG